MIYLVLSKIGNALVGVFMTEYRRKRYQRRYPTSSTSATRKDYRGR